MPTILLMYYLRRMGEADAARVFVQTFLGNIQETPLSELVASEKQVRFGLDKLQGLPDTAGPVMSASPATVSAPRTEF